MKPNISTFSVDGFRTDRNEIYNFVVDNLWDNTKDCAITAPVKSGKRLMVELLAKLSQRSHGESPSQYHFYITSLNRQDTKEQLDELQEYGVISLVMCRKDDVSKAIREIKVKKDTGIPVIVHFDESDYGTEREQLMAKVYSQIKAMGVRFVYYSATNEEVLFSSKAEAGDIVRYDFVPNADYRGAEWFLQNNLVKEATEFYDANGLTPQGVEACCNFIKSPKTIAILRDITNSLEQNSDIKDELFSKYGIKCVFVDGKRPFNWKNGYKEFIRDEYVKVNGSFQKIRYLLCLCQTCTRSTEVGFHEHIAFWHDYRTETATYATMAQAFLRIAHYHKDGHPILVYARKEVFELAARRIDYNQYQKQLSSRVGKDTNEYEMTILDSYDDIPENDRPKDRNSRKISQNPAQNLADAVLKGISRSKESPVVHIDGCCQTAGKEVSVEEHKTSWKLLEEQHPDWVGKWAYFIPRSEDEINKPKTKKNSLFYEEE